MLPRRTREPRHRPFARQRSAGVLAGTTAFHWPASSVGTPCPDPVALRRSGSVFYPDRGWRFAPACCAAQSEGHVGQSPRSCSTLRERCAHEGSVARKALLPTSRVRLAAAPRRAHELGGAKRNLTPRSSRGPTAWHQAREAVRHIILLAGLAPHRRSRLTSNVRSRNTSDAPALRTASRRSFHRLHQAASGRAVSPACGLKRRAVGQRARHFTFRLCTLGVAQSPCRQRAGVVYRAAISSPDPVPLRLSPVRARAPTRSGHDFQSESGWRFAPACCAARSEVQAGQSHRRPARFGIAALSRATRYTTAAVRNARAAS